MRHIIVLLVVLALAAPAYAIDAPPAMRKQFPQITYPKKRTVRSIPQKRTAGKKQVTRRHSRSSVVRKVSPYRVRRIGDSVLVDYQWTGSRPLPVPSPAIHPAAMFPYAVETMRGAGWPIVDRPLYFKLEIPLVGIAIRLGW